MKRKSTIGICAAAVAFRGFKGRYRLSWKDASDNERETLVEVK